LPDARVARSHDAYHQGREDQMSGGAEQLVFSGPVLLAIPVAAAAGAITFLSPCCLPLVPGYLSYVTGMSGSVSAAPENPPPPDEGACGAATATITVARSRTRPRGRVMLGTLLFVVGFSVLFAVEGITVSSMGAVLAGHAAGLSRILGAVIIVFGLMFLGVFDRFTIAGRVFRPSWRPRAGLAGAPLLGVLFGLGWTPCIGPALTAVLLLGQSTGTVVRGGVLAFAYGLGIGIPFLIMAFAIQRGVSVFGFARRHARLIMQLGGLLLIAVGILEVTGAWSNAVIWLKVHWPGGYTTPL
jgi:cytochrome c-type biogenesis protein